MNKFLITLACLPLASTWALDTQPLSGAEQLPSARMTENGKAYLDDTVRKEALIERMWLL